ncbi:MAG: AIR synthase-related protein [Bacteroidota bacterium]
MSEQLKYDLRGVSASKSEVHAAIKNMDKGLYPNAFCKILPDVAAGDPAYCNLMHADTAGTKTSLAYLYWKETGDLSVWEGIAQDALVMNLDDMACVGCVDDIIISSTIGRNKHLITGDVISTLINAATQFIAEMKKYGVTIHHAGGETADVGDIVRTIDVGYTAFARMKRSELIVNDIKPGDVIVGLASYGQASYEESYNGGMGSNGLTSARHDVFDHQYAGKYPESFDPNTPDELVYAGKGILNVPVEVPGGTMDLGKLVLSPTRTYLPVIQQLLTQLKNKINGMIHCTGGAQTKVLKFVDELHIIKDNLLPVPPLFKIIHEYSGTPWREMYQVFNMGHRLEVYLAEADAVKVLDIAKQFNIDAQVIGRVEKGTGRSLSLTAADGQVYKYNE